ncbi:conserved hypothetical protein [Shewanella sp. W3-18-1]|nr:conserved hypothetical protein [Shewanella sp. W3-18-1]
MTVGGMDAAVEPIGIYSRRVTGETVAMYITQYTIQISCFGAIAFLAKRTAIGLVKIGIVASVTVGDMAALSHLTQGDMGNVTMMSGTLLTM